MISRSHRFHGYGSLRYIYKNGKTVRGPLNSLKYIDNPKRKAYRLSVVVNKKVNKSAVVRNRIRRRIYESFRERENLVPEPYDLVVTVFSDQILELTPSKLDQLLRAQLKQAGIIRSKA